MRQAIAIGTTEHFRWLNGIVRAVLVLNLLDAVFTLAWVRSGLAEEANALLRDLVYEQALTFMLAKILVVSVGALVLWKTRTRPLAVISIFVAFLAYYIVFLYHLENSSVFVLGF